MYSEVVEVHTLLLKRSHKWTSTLRVKCSVSNKEFDSNMSLVHEKKNKCV